MLRLVRRHYLRAVARRGPASRPPPARRHPRTAISGERFVWLSLDNTDKRPPGTGVPGFIFATCFGTRSSRPEESARPGRAALSSPVCGNGPGPRATGGQSSPSHDASRATSRISGPSSRVSTSARRKAPYRVIEQPAIARDGIISGCERSRVNCQWNSPTGGNVDLLAQARRAHRDARTGNGRPARKRRRRRRKTPSGSAGRAAGQ